MLKTRGIEGVRVLQGLLALSTRHPCEAMEEACADGAFLRRVPTADASSSF